MPITDQLRRMIEVEDRIDHRGIARGGIPDQIADRVGRLVEERLDERLGHDFLLATAMPLPFAIGTSLVVVTALGLTTASSYAVSGLVDWRITAVLIAGGIVGTLGGIAAGRLLSARKGLLERLFAVIVVGVGLYVAASSL